MSGIRPLDCSKSAKNPKNDNDVIIFRHEVNVKYFWRCFVSFVKFSYWSKFHVISSLVLELWQFSFLRDWPEIRKSEMPTSEFFPIFGDWGELWIPHLAWRPLIECYSMLQNSRVTAFTVFELLRENQLVCVGGGVKITPPPSPRLGVKHKQRNVQSKKNWYNLHSLFPIWWCRHRQINWNLYFMF